MPANFLHSLVGSMSQGAAGNPTVAMVEAAFRHHGLHWRYVNMEVPHAGLADAVRGARAMGFRGFNLSMPHKVAVISHLDGLVESASLIGAVNCVVRRGEKFIGENTDGKGFLKSLQEICDPRGKNVVMFGAGGAARPRGQPPLLCQRCQPHGDAGVRRLYRRTQCARRGLCAAVWSARDRGARAWARSRVRCAGSALRAGLINGQRPGARLARSRSSSLPRCRGAAPSSRRLKSSARGVSAPRYTLKP